MAEKILLDSVRSVLGSWTVLKLAVQHGFGGIDSEDKAEWLVEVTNQVLRDNETIEYYELADYIEEILYNEFHTVVEDGSLPKVAQKLCSIHQLWKNGHVGQIQEEIRSTPTPKLRQCENGASKGKSSDDEDDGDDVIKKEKRNAMCNGHFEPDKNENSTRVTQQFHQLHISENTQRRLSNSSSQRSGDQALDENCSDQAQLTPEEDGWEVVRRSKRR